MECSALSEEREFPLMEDEVIEPLSSSALFCVRSQREDQFRSGNIPFSIDHCCYLWGGRVAVATGGGCHRAFITILHENQQVTSVCGGEEVVEWGAMQSATKCMLFGSLPQPQSRGDHHQDPLLPKTGSEDWWTSLICADKTSITAVHPRKRLLFHKMGCFALCMYWVSE